MKGKYNSQPTKAVVAPVMSEDRAAINRARRVAHKLGMKASDVRPFLLKMYAPLVANNSSLKFQTNLVNGQHPMEILLDKSDAFYGHKVGLAIHQVKLDANGKEIPANTRLIHYVDKNLFSGPAIAPGITSEAESLQMLYNSLLFLKTDQDVRLENFSTEVFETIPETQYDPAAPSTAWGKEGTEAKDLGMSFGVYGNKRNEMRIELPGEAGDYSAIAGVPGVTRNYAVLLFKGFIIVRGAEALTKGDAAQLLNF